MKENSIVTYDKIVEYFEKFNDVKLVTKGAGGLKDGKCKHVNYDRDLGVLAGEVWASMKPKYYKVRIFLNNVGGIKSCTCQCPNGDSDRCHHVAVLALYAVQNISCTSVSCSWSAPSKPGFGNKGLSIAQLKPQSRVFKAFSPYKREVMVRYVKSHPRSTPAGLNVKWLLTPWTEEDEDSYLSDKERALEAEIAGLRPCVPSIEQIVLSPAYRDASSPTDFLRSKARVDWNVIVAVAKATAGQSQNPFWFEVRKNRGSASVFGKMLSNIRSGRSCKALTKEISGAVPRDLTNVASVRWGKDHEKAGILAFEAWCLETSGEECKVLETGVWLHESGLLAASPDGLVQPSAIVEVKCPYTIREMPFTQGLMSMKDYIIYWDSTLGEWLVNKEHNIYHQIQGQLYITRRSMCFLVIWHKAEPPVVKHISKDPDWEDNMEKMINWMCSTYVRQVFDQ